MPEFADAMVPDESGPVPASEAEEDAEDVPETVVADDDTTEDDEE